MTYSIGTITLASQGTVTLPLSTIFEQTVPDTFNGSFAPGSTEPKFVMAENHTNTTEGILDIGQATSVQFVDLDKFPANFVINEIVAGQTGGTSTLNVGHSFANGVIYSINATLNTSNATETATVNIDATASGTETTFSTVCNVENILANGMSMVPPAPFGNLGVVVDPGTPEGLNGQIFTTAGGTQTVTFFPLLSQGLPPDYTPVPNPVWLGSWSDPATGTCFQFVQSSPTGSATGRVIYVERTVNGAPGSVNLYEFSGGEFANNLYPLHGTTQNGIYSILVNEALVEFNLMEGQYTLFVFVPSDSTATLCYEAALNPSVFNSAHKDRLGNWWLTTNNN